MGWRLRLRTCYIGHLKYPSMGRKGVKKKIYQSIEFSFKIAKSKLQKKKKIKTILVLMKTHNITTVVDKFVIDAKSKVCLRH